MNQKFVGKIMYKDHIYFTNWHCEHIVIGVAFAVVLVAFPRVLLSQWGHQRRVLCSVLPYSSPTKHDNKRYDFMFHGPTFCRLLPRHGFFAQLLADIWREVVHGNSS